MSLDWSYTFAETSTRRLQQILNFLGEHKKTQEARSRHTRVGLDLKLQGDPTPTYRYRDLSVDLGSKACTLFRLGTDVRYTNVSVGAKMQAYCTISRHR